VIESLGQVAELV